MNKTQKALKLAIEQMQHLIKIYIPSPEWSGTAIQEDCYETIQACKEALASNSEALATEQVREDDVQSAHEPDLIWQDGKIKKRKDLNLYGGEKFYTHPAPEQEPFGYWVEYGEEKDFDMAFRYPDKDDYYPSDIKAVTKLYTHHAPQPAQEPVAWMIFDVYGNGEYVPNDSNKFFTLQTTAKQKPIPLYTHPAPAREPLSEDDKKKLHKEHHLYIPTIEKIESMLKEKNYA